MAPDPRIRLHGLKMGWDPGKSRAALVVEIAQKQNVHFFLCVPAVPESRVSEKAPSLCTVINSAKHTDGCWITPSIEENPSVLVSLSPISYFLFCFLRNELRKTLFHF